MALMICTLTVSSTSYPEQLQILMGSNFWNGGSYGVFYFVLVIDLSIKFSDGPRGHNKVRSMLGVMLGVMFSLLGSFWHLFRIRLGASVAPTRSTTNGLEQAAN